MMSDQANVLPGPANDNFQKLYESLLSSIPSSLLMIDRNLRVVTANRNFLEKARRNEANTLNQRIDNVFPRVLLDYTQMDQKITRAFRTGQPLEGGKLSYRAPGVPSRTYYYRLTPVVDDSTVTYVILLMDDITEQEQLTQEIRRVERHLASVVESANDIVVSLDTEKRILTWNRAAERIFGWRADEIVGRRLIDLWPEQEESLTEMLPLLAHGQPVHPLETTLTTQDGRSVPISWVNSLMRDQQEQVVGFVAIGRDLTEQRRLEAQIFQAAKMASLGIMAGGIAHEIRNPLGIISVAAQLLGERPDDVDLRNECLRRIGAGVQRSSQIIESLLKFARPPEEGMKPLEVAAVLDEALDLVSNQIKVSHVNLDQDVATDLPCVMGNRSLLQQVFTNLILNACNAMPDGGVLRIVGRVNDGRHVEIAFSDTGRGIPGENLHKIFDPFFTTMAPGQGAGLGLTISYSIIQQHQGTIDVQSEPGRGATFRVTLPPMPST